MGVTRKLMNETSDSYETQDLFVEGISLCNEVVRSIGRGHLTTFSQNVNLNQIWLICNIGMGAFASVFLVKKEEEACAVKATRYFNYYAMKVINK